MASNEVRNRRLENAAQSPVAQSHDRVSFFPGGARRPDGTFSYDDPKRNNRTLPDNQVSGGSGTGDSGQQDVEMTSASQTGVESSSTQQTHGQEQTAAGYVVTPGVGERSQSSGPYSLYAGFSSMLPEISQANDQLMEQRRKEQEEREKTDLGK